MTHPFIEAVQAAYDTHGLPPGICYVAVGSLVTGTTPHFTAYATPQSGALANCSAQADTAAGVVTAALRKQAEADILAGQREQLRAMAVQAGIDPGLVR